MKIALMIIGFFGLSVISLILYNLWRALRKPAPEPNSRKLDKFLSEWKQ